jgi:hypothetical protein
MTTPTPSENLPSRVASDGDIARQVAVDIATMDTEVRVSASADLINGSRPLSREQAENMILRAQRDQLAARVQTLRAELAPMQLVLQMLTAVALRSIGRELFASDAEVDAAATRPIQLRRAEDRDARVPGWVVDTMPGATAYPNWRGRA